MPAKPKFLEIACKDITVEFRSKSTVSLMILFSLITSMLFSITVPVFYAQEIGSSLLWLIFIFVGMLGYARAFIREVELETLEGLKLAPIHPASILAGKMLYNIVLMLLMEIVVIPIFVGVFNMSIARPIVFLAVLTLGNTAFAITISSLAILIIKSHSKELLLPVIAFPVIFPVVSSTVFALNMAVKGNVYGIESPVKIVISFAAIVLSVAFLTSEYAFTD
ncbi:MAG: cytochrome C biogenesis protein [Archaeoglobus sp.]|jgi:heme exporter protein B|nr:MAG: cytochrome C biogenesis protein [Archaeoglobus sp.]